jgi:hypothetical protein
MRIAEIGPGCWAMIDTDGAVLKTFSSNAAAWRWIDRNTDAGRGDTDRYNRIRDAFAER